MSVIYLDLMSPLNSCSLPLGIERAILHAPAYLTLQPLSSTVSYIAIRTGKFLPYLLTLTFPVCHSALDAESTQKRRLFSST